MYPSKIIEGSMVGEVCKKHSSVTLLGEKTGSKLAKGYGLWVDQDSKVNPSAAIRTGFVKFFFVNTVRLGEDQYQKHAFASICWYKEDSQRELHRRPVEIWKLKCFSHPGPATFMPVQRCF